MGRNTCPLLTSIRKAILPLNNSLPSSVASIWLTPLELHARLLMAGVSKRLTLCMLTDALRLYNKTEAYMTKREQSKVVYYRSTIAHMKDNTNNVPIHQRFCGKSTGRGRRVKTNAAHGYFTHNDNIHFQTVNNALAALDRKAKDEVAKEKERSKRAKSK